MWRLARLAALRPGDVEPFAISPSRRVAFDLCGVVEFTLVEAS
jgi:hypothetical protein